MALTHLVPVIAALPLAGFLTLTFAGRRVASRAGWIASTAVGLAFLTAVAAGLAYRGLPDDDGPYAVTLWRWIDAGVPEIHLTLAAEPLEALVPIEAGQVMERWWPVGPGMEAAAARMWDADAVVGVRPIQAAVPAWTPLSDRNVPPAPELVPAARRAPMAVALAFQLDALSLFMALVVTGVGFLIHVYATGYMAGDPDRRRFFAYMNLFVFSMLVLVLAADFLVLFVGWELVGLCSYLLIGFWYRNPDNASAGRKAFIVNRVGDFAFLIGLMLMWSTFGSLAFADVLPRAADVLAPGVASPGGATAVAIAALLLVGVTGKSAQIPLFVWLPDAMAGPTPVSALIHAATMVTAGVYLIARAHAIFEQAPVVLAAVAVLGAATALAGALAATVQVDIKRVLAYSTISQLGYMMLAVGATAYVAGLFHLMTHAFFKALLFLCAGSVMHGLQHAGGAEESGAGAATASGGDGPVRAAAGDAPDAPVDIHGPADPFACTPAHQDMRLMGGLWGRMGLTGPAFAAGALALAGVFPFAGFWSKDEILLAVWQRGGAFWSTLYAVGLATAFVTAFYAGRALLLVFAGRPRSGAAEGAAEAPRGMAVPLAILAGLAVVGGLPALGLGGDDSPLQRWFGPVFGAVAHGPGGASPVPLVPAAVATAVALAGLALAWAVYGLRPSLGKAALGPAGAAIWRASAMAFYVDRLYMRAFVQPFRRAADALWRRVDDGIIDGTVNGVGRGVAAIGQGLRRAQAGYLRGYALTMVAGAVLLLAYLYTAAVR